MTEVAAVEGGQALAVLAPKFDRVAPDLKAIANWLPWRAMPKEDEPGKLKKLPVNRSGRVKSAHDAANHQSFDEARAQYEAAEHGVGWGKLGGIAFDLPDGGVTKIDEAGRELVLVGLDFDRCVSLSEDGKPSLEERVRTTLEALGTYHEVSPSGTGIRAFVWCSDPASYLDLKGITGIEVYTRGRFLTVTGGKGTIRVHTAETINRALAHYPRKGKAKPKPPAARQSINDELMSRGPAFVLPDRVHDGEGRERTLLALAGSLRARGVSQPEIEAAVIECNERRFDPPIDDEDTVLERARRYATSDAVEVADTAKPVVYGAAPPQTMPNVFLSADEAVEAINRGGYFVSPSECGRPCIWHESIDPETGNPRLTPLGNDEFRLALSNKVIVPAEHGASSKVSVPTAWLTSPKRREYPRGLALLPHKPAPPGVFNLWRGWGVEPREGDVSPVLDLLGGMLVDEKAVAYAVDWFARGVQRPELPSEVALVLRGPEGTGKGTVGRAMCKLYGRHGLHLTHTHHLTGHFNGHLRGALFAFADEAVFVGDRSADNALKGLITEPTIAIERKGRDVFSCPNRMKVFMATNSGWAVRAATDSRRYAVFDVVPTLVGNRAFFRRINEWLELGGCSYWLHHLLHRDLSGFEVRDFPITKALESQRVQTLDALDRWILEALSTRTAPAGGGEWGEDGVRVPCSSALAAFNAFLDQQRERWTRADTRAIGKRFNEVFGCGASQTGPDTGRGDSAGRVRVKGWKLPGITEARGMAAKAFGLSGIEDV